MRDALLGSSQLVRRRSERQQRQKYDIESTKVNRKRQSEWENEMTRKRIKKEAEIEEKGKDRAREKK